ncbi:MAG: protein phosphatase 2C family protein [Pirellulales bacterium]|nr:protein phosphatase 2C family protein [Pirellulales bacterium]
MLTTPESVLIVVADGAGGSGDGNVAATTVIDRVEDFGSKTQKCPSWCDALKKIDLAIGEGESTAVVVEMNGDGISGASVGDSRAWIIRNRQIMDLTASQHRKPLLGSGKVSPVGFFHSSLDGLLIVATDGFCNYSNCKRN